MEAKKRKSTSKKLLPFAAVQELYRAAKNVSRRSNKRDLRRAVDMVEAIIGVRDSEFGSAAVFIAKRKYSRDGMIRIDDSGISYRGKNCWWIASWCQVSDDEICDQCARCVNCCRLWLISELQPAADLGQRTSIDDDVMGECPDCHALCWPVEHHIRNGYRKGKR